MPTLPQTRRSFVLTPELLFVNYVPALGHEEPFFQGEGLGWGVRSQGGREQKGIPVPQSHAKILECDGELVQEAPPPTGPCCGGTHCSGPQR